MKPIIIIPARMQSTRLPNKPMAIIAGVPMIVQVVRRSEESGIADVYVACAENEICQEVEKYGGKAVLTDPGHQSGTDRIYEALQKIDPDKNYDVVINVQGDLPTIDPTIINDVLRPFENENIDIATLVTKITDDEEYINPNVVKAVVAWNEDESQGKALYFTRATAPANEGDLYHHIGLYAYRRDALEKFTSLPPSKLEQRENLEQLRALEDNMHIEVVAVSDVPLGVDTEEDLERARKILADVSN